MEVACAELKGNVELLATLGVHLFARRTSPMDFQVARFCCCSKKVLSRLIRLSEYDMKNNKH